MGFGGYGGGITALTQATSVKRPPYTYLIPTGGIYSYHLSLKLPQTDPHSSGVAGVQAPSSQSLSQGRHHIPGGRGWVMVGQGQESPGGPQDRPAPVPKESQPLGSRPPPHLDGGAGVKATEEENGPCVTEATRKQSHLSGEDSESPTAAGNYNYV